MLYVVVRATLYASLSDLALRCLPAKVVNIVWYGEPGDSRHGPPSCYEGALVPGQWFHSMSPSSGRFGQSFAELCHDAGYPDKVLFAELCQMLVESTFGIKRSRRTQPY